MGLSYASQYTWTDHFAQRAQERFEVNADSLSKWVGRQIASLTIYDSTVEQRPEEKKYVSDYGVIFVCNTIEQKFIMRQMMLLWKERRLPFMNIMLTHSRKKLKI